MVELDTVWQSLFDIREVTAFHDVFVCVERNNV